MTVSATIPPDDADLVAFLDGELAPTERVQLAERLEQDPALCRRLAQLAAGNRAFRQAGELLLEDAPLERLHANLVRHEQNVARARPIRRYAYAAAAAVLLFFAGLAIGIWLPVRPESTSNEEAETNWRQVVAEYLELYTKDTLAPLPEDASVRGRELALLGSKLGVDVSPPRVALDDLHLKTAQLFELRGMPLGQISYIDADGTPVSLCIIRNGAEAAPLSVEQRQGFTLVHWAANGRAFLLIGHLPADRLQTMANSISQRLAS
jgi:anti-sigma factor RsiW